MQRILGNPVWELTARQHHESYESDPLLPELPLIGRMHLLDALPASLVPHAHEGAFEVHLVVDGCLSFHAREQDFDVTGGMVFLTKPGEIHSGVDTTLQPAEWYWVHIKFPPEEALPGLTLEQTREIERSFSDSSLCMFPGSDSLRDCFLRLINEYRNRGSHSQTIARGMFHELLVRLTRDHEKALKSADRTGVSAGIRKALAWLDQNLGEELSIPDLAAASGLSQSYFRECFHKETGFTPSDYLNRRRITHAKAFLRGHEMTITDIAFRLGFQSSPYFAAVFKKFTGMTPTEYRDRMHAASSRD
jgi:AraC-like DNA-binding protein